MLTLGFDFGSVYVKAALLDERGRLLETFYHKHGGADGPALAGFLAELERRRPGLRVRAGLTGSEEVPALAGSVTVTHGLLALAAGVRALHPGLRRILEVGGQTSKFLALDPAGGLCDFATSGACAAGTGAFLEQQARRLDLPVPELAALAAGAERAATIAGRCSVFATSDMIHLQQKGTPLAEIACGLCAAIARNALATLLKGRDPEFPLVLAGGCARNQGIVRAFRELLDPAGPEAVLVSAQPGLEAAIGAAALATQGPALAMAELDELVAGLAAGARREARRHPPLQRPVRGPAPAEPLGRAAEAYLGIDVGSVSTDLVLLDAGGDLLASVYLATRGRPAEVLLEGLAQLEALGGRPRILGCGATGSGRYLAGKLAGADVVKNEITCQLLGARRFFPQVDTLFEIGGQDSKFVRASAGALTDFAMNKVCAAGTGSFLEERSRDLGIAIQDEFAERAFQSRAPLDLGSRCTVFMATEVAGALAQGGTPEDLCAGLALAVVRNYLDKVVGTRPLGREIVLQGGVASNQAVVAAFEQVLGRPVQVHPWNRISGAIGAALAARAARPRATGFKGFRPAARPALSSFECQHCPNRCEVNVITTEAGPSFFGDTCERYTSGGPARDCPVPSLAQAYLERCEALCAPERPGPRIGLPRASTLMGQLPFWATFWKQLGWQPVLSAASSQETLALGLKHLPVNVCLPIRLTAGHVHALLAQGLPQVFVPAVTRLPGEDPASAHACPYTMAVPFIVDAPGGDRCLAPVLSFESEEVFAAGFDSCRGLGVTRDQLRQAFRAGMAAQAEVLAEFRARARDLLAAGGHRYAFAVLGRPYVLFDSYVNLGLFERLRRLGVLALPMPFLPAPETAAEPGLPWRYPQDSRRAAAGLRSGPIHPVVLTSYGCGPDAFSLPRLGELLGGRPQLTLELDEHRGEAGLVTRIEAFLDQLEVAGTPSAAPGPPAEPPFSLAGPVPVWIPYFADHAYAYSGLLRHLGHAARVLAPPDPGILALGEKYSLGRECHAYPMILGDLLRLAERGVPPGSVFFFPGTSIPCLLHEYGRGMQALLRELGIDDIRVWSPRGPELVAAVGLKPLERFYAGLLAIELLVKAVCQVRPYERTAGLTDLLHQENLEAIEAAVAGGDVLAALDQSLGRLAQVPRSAAAGPGRPVVGLVGDLYTRVNRVANQDLVRWLEQQGLEVWPAPFQIDLLDFGISRRLFHSLASRDLSSLLGSGSLALLREFHHWRVRTVAGSRVARQEEPGYLEQKRLAGPYMANEAHELLFLQVAKTVEFAQGGANGIANAICFNCMVGTAAAAVNERIRRDYDDLPILTAVYTGADDPSRRLALEAFVSQVKAHHRRHLERGPQVALASS